MKKIFTSVLLLLFAYLSAIDTICKTTGEEIECKVVEIINDQINYKFPNDEILNTISKSDVLFIRYENGEKDNFYEYLNSDEIKRKKLKEKKKQQHKNFYIFAGFGSSWLEPNRSSEANIDASVPSYLVGIGLNQQPFDLFGFREEISMSMICIEDENYCLKSSEEIHAFNLDFLLSFRPLLFSTLFDPYFSFGGRVSVSDAGEEELLYGLIACMGTNIYNLFFVECRFDYALTNSYWGHSRNNFERVDYKDRSVWGIIGYRF